MDRDSTKRKRRDPFSRQSRLLGWLLFVVGTALFVLFNVAGRMEARTSFLLGAVIMGVGGAIALSLRDQAKRHFSRPADELLAPSGRPPVLYLRKFDEDDEAWEERMARSLSRVGPLVAIGDPRDRLPPPGAARLYAIEGDWQTKVSALIERSALVALKAGDTEGIRWEVEQVLSRVPPSRVLLFLPMSRLNKKRVDQDRYRAFLEVAGHLFPRPLPDVPDLGDVIYFGDDWTPRLVASWRSAREAASSSHLKADNRRTALAGLASEFEFRLKGIDIVLLIVPVLLIGAIAAPAVLREVGESTWWGLRTSEKDLLDRARPQFDRIAASLRGALAPAAAASGPLSDGGPSPRPIYGTLEEAPNTDILTDGQVAWLTGAGEATAKPGLSTSLVPAANLIRRHDPRSRSRRPDEAFARTLEAATRLLYVAIVYPGDAVVEPVDSASEWRAATTYRADLVRIEDGAVIVSATIPIETRFKEVDESEVGGGPARGLRRSGDGPPPATLQGADLYELLGWRVRRAGEAPGAREAFARERIRHSAQAAILEGLARLTGGQFRKP
jgi:hypothetical protein